MMCSIYRFPIVGFTVRSTVFLKRFRRSTDLREPINRFKFDPFFQNTSGCGVFSGKFFSGFTGYGLYLLYLRKNYSIRERRQSLNLCLHKKTLRFPEKQKTCAKKKSARLTVFSEGRVYLGIQSTIHQIFWGCVPSLHTENTDFHRSTVFSVDRY